MISERARGCIWTSLLTGIKEFIGKADTISHRLISKLYAVHICCKSNSWNRNCIGGVQPVPWAVGGAFSGRDALKTRIF